MYLIKRHNKSNFTFQSFIFIENFIMSINWTGVFPALTTKFTADDKLDLPLFEKNLNAQLAAGVNGIVLGGTLGEASVLTTAAMRIA